MATLTVRNIRPELHAFLRRRAAENGRSMEAEVRDLLERTMARGGRSPRKVVDALQALGRDLDGVDDLALPDRPPPRSPPDFAA